MKLAVAVVTAYHEPPRIMNNDNLDLYFMNEALKEAKKAALKDEVPVGCVIVYNKKIIARGHNNRQKENSVFGHAEIIAIKKANKKLKTWLLENCDIYITLEPCLMCAGAIMQSRMRRLIFATFEPKFGVAGSIINVFTNPAFNHQVEITYGILQLETSQLMKDFFKDLRNR